MLEWREALKIRGIEFYLDSRRPRPVSFVSHAHSDHTAQHELSLCTPETAALAHHRSSADRVQHLTVGNTTSWDSDTRLTAHHAGHVLGSSMLRVERPEGSLLYTGDFKLRSSLTVPAAEPPTADYVVMESTYGKPFFRFPPPASIISALIEILHTALRTGKQPIVLGYSLGKAQEVVRTITDAGLPVTEHGAVAGISDVYEAHGVPLGPRRRYAAADFHGPRQLDLAERGVIVAPPNVARSAFVDRFEQKVTVMMSGWGLLRDAKFRYGVDHVLPLSDHADFDELLKLVEIVRPRKVFTHHGFPEFVDHLRKIGVDACLAKPDPQLSLFD
jgi:Cft2 family RNA processing exonuclease